MGRSATGGVPPAGTGLGAATGRVPTPDDAALATRAALGDRQAFGLIAERHGPALLRFARTMVRDADEAQDVVQEALVAAWLNIDRFDGRSSLTSWLFGITVNKSRDLRRRRRPTPVLPEVLVDAEQVADGSSGGSEGALFRADLAEALAGLPERQRASWLLTQVEGLSQAEAAVALRMTPDAVRGQVARARRALSERLEAWR